MIRPRPAAHARLAAQARHQIASSIAPIRPEGCNRETARCANARDYGQLLNPCCKAHLKQIVSDVATVFEEFRVTWWADYGTLLGAVRNPMTTWADYPWLPQDNPAPLVPGVVPHDKDADFGVFGINFNAMCRMRTKLERMGYRVLVRPGGRSMKVRLSHANWTNADFFNWIEGSGGVLKRLSYTGADQYKGRHFHKDILFPLSAVEWEGLTLPAPKDPEAFAAFRYGPTWKTPVRANHDGVAR